MVAYILYLARYFLKRSGFDFLTLATKAYKLVSVPLTQTKTWYDILKLTDMNNLSRCKNYYSIQTIRCSGSRIYSQQTPTVEKHAHLPRVVYYLYIIYRLPLLISQIAARVCNLHSTHSTVAQTCLWIQIVTLLSPCRSLDPRLGLGNTWARQLGVRQLTLIFPLAATRCSVSSLD